MPQPSIPRDYRSTYANQRDEDARLRWPPTALDYRLDALDPTDADRFRERAVAQRRRRGFAPSAVEIFENEFEQHLTELAMLLVLEGA